MKTTQIAKTAHSIHLAYCKSVNHKTQPEWENLADDHKYVIKTSVLKILTGEIKNVVQSHDLFLESKKKSGWIYGKDYSLEEKTNPRLVSFSKLDCHDKIKETLFFECVKSFI